MQVKFEDFVNLEECETNLSRAMNLLSITLKLFDDGRELTDYAQQYEAVLVSAMQLIDNERNSIQSVFNTLNSKKGIVA